MFSNVSLGALPFIAFVVIVVLIMAGVFDGKQGD
jgi:hypothetical protein